MKSDIKLFAFKGDSNTGWECYVFIGVFRKHLKWILDLVGFINVGNRCTA